MAFEGVRRGPTAAAARCQDSSSATLNGGSGSIKPYNLGDQFPRFVSISVIAGPQPIVATERTVLTGGFFS